MLQKKRTNGRLCLPNAETNARFWEVGRGVWPYHRAGAGLIYIYIHTHIHTYILYTRACIINMQTRVSKNEDPKFSKPIISHNQTQKLKHCYPISSSNKVLQNLFFERTILATNKAWLLVLLQIVSFLCLETVTACYRYMVAFNIYNTYIPLHTRHVTLWCTAKDRAPRTGSCSRYNLKIQVRTDGSGLNISNFWNRRRRATLLWNINVWY